MREIEVEMGRGGDCGRGRKEKSGVPNLAQLTQT